MAFSIIGASADTALTWCYGDTPCYRFVFVINQGIVIPPETLIDITICTPHGNPVFAKTFSFTLLPDKCPYFDVLISIRNSLRIPPGNYVYTITLNRPYERKGNYRYSPIASAPVRVTGKVALHHKNLAEIEHAGSIEPPTPRTIIVKCPQIAWFLSGHPDALCPCEPDHTTPPPPPPVGYGCDCSPEQGGNLVVVNFTAKTITIPTSPAGFQKTVEALLMMLVFGKITEIHENTVSVLFTIGSDMNTLTLPYQGTLQTAAVNDLVFIDRQWDIFPQETEIVYVLNESRSSVVPRVGDVTMTVSDTEAIPDVVIDSILLIAGFPVLQS